MISGTAPTKLTGSAPRAALGGRALGLASAGALAAATAALVGFPYWAARRILYPAFSEPMPEHLLAGVELGEDVRGEKVVFPGPAGSALGGWFVPGPGVPPWPAVLLLYGYGGYKEQMAGYARLLRSEGFASLMFDMEGSGLRRGHAVTLGAREKDQAVAAARYLATRPDVATPGVGALGVSMGAVTALLAASEEPTIAAIASDSAFADIAGVVRPGLRAFLGPGAARLAPLIVLWCELMIGVRARDLVPAQAASKLGARPLLIIHGADDKLIHVESAHTIAAAATGPTDVWIVPECGHGEAPDVAPDEYSRRVNGFFRRALVPEPTGNARSAL